MLLEVALYLAFVLGLALIILLMA